MRYDYTFRMPSLHHPYELPLELSDIVLEEFLIEENSLIREITFNNKRFRSSQNLSSDKKSDNTDLFAEWWRLFLNSDSPHNVNVEFSDHAVTFIDLFSSVGGLSLGFQEACNALGIQSIPLLAVDVDNLALRIHKSNHQTERTLNQSVASLVDFKVEGKGGAARFAYKPELVDEVSKTLKNKVDVIIAGPPCQGHSTLNNHSRGDDPRNLLYLTVPALAIALNAKHVIIENVPNVIHDKESVVATSIELLTQNGFKATWGVLSAHRLGWPQTRKRFFIVASREGSPLSLDYLSKQFKKQPLPVTWAISDFTNSNEAKGHLMNQLPEMSAENLERVNWLFDNESYELPNHVRPLCHQDGHTYPSVYGRMRPDQPAPTLTTGFSSPGRGRFIHPLERRVLTAREAARLQGFPNWFNFLDGEKTTRSDLAKWIGDAVPSILGYFATLSLVRQLSSAE